MNIVIALVTGSLIGWAFSSFGGGAKGREGMLLNLIVGFIGAYLGGWLVTSIYHSGVSAGVSLDTWLAAMLGAATSLIIVNRIQRA